MHTLVWPLPHRPVQLGWTCQECETPTDIALGVIEARKPSHHFRVHVSGDGFFPATCKTASGATPLRKLYFQTCYLLQSQHADTGPTSPNADPVAPDARQGSHQGTKVETDGLIGQREKGD